MPKKATKKVVESSSDDSSSDESVQVVKKPVAKSKLVNAAINKKVEAIKEEDEDGGGHDGVGDSQVLPKRNEPSKPKEYTEPQHSRTESAMKRDNEVLDKLDAELKTQEQNLNSKKVK